jgi:hypothetical protein
MRKLGLLITLIVFPLASILVICLFQSERKIAAIFVKLIEAGTILKEIIADLEESITLTKKMVIEIKFNNLCKILEKYQNLYHFPVTPFFKN